MPVFFSDDDRRDYLGLLCEQGQRFGVQYIAWCLMDNHIHLIAVPENESSLAKGVDKAHKQYSRLINFREGIVIMSCSKENTKKEDPTPNHLFHAHLL